MQAIVDAMPARDAPADWPLFDVVLNVTGDRQRIPPRWGEVDVVPVDIRDAEALNAMMLYVRDDAPFALELVHRLDALGLHPRRHAAQ